MTHYLSIPVRSRRQSSWFEDHGKSSSKIAPHTRGSKSSISRSPILSSYQLELAEHLQTFAAINSKIVKINVGGQMFQTYECTLQKIPKTRLAELDITSPFYDESTDSYFFDRNPVLFQSILDFYREGEMHIPRDICARKIEKDLLFWKIHASSMADCCRTYYEDSLDEMTSHEILLDEFKNIPKNIYSVHSKIYDHFDSSDLRIRIWEFLDDFSSSKYAKVWHSFYMFLVIVSILTFFCSTLSGCRVPLEDSLYRIMGTDHKHLNNSHTIGSEEIEKIQKLLNTASHPVLEVIELSCLILFTIEFILRFTVCPWKLRLFKNFTTLVDLLYIIPAWVVIIVEVTQGTFWHTKTGITVFIIMESLEVFRVFRIFRFVKHYKGIRMLYLAIRCSFSELSMLLTFVLFNITIFASLIYCAESFTPDYFENAFHGMWWALITMTTVGYGDFYPKSWLGYIVGSVCALTGIIMIQMPVPIIVSNFHAYYRLRIPDEDEEGTLTPRISSSDADVDSKDDAEKSPKENVLKIQKNDEDNERRSDTEDVERNLPTTSNEKEQKSIFHLPPVNKVSITNTERTSLDKDIDECL